MRTFDGQGRQQVLRPERASNDLGQIARYNRANFAAFGHACTRNPCEFCAAPMRILCEFHANPMPILCEPHAHSMRIACGFYAYPMRIHANFMQILHKLALFPSTRMQIRMIVAHRLPCPCVCLLLRQAPFFVVPLPPRLPVPANRSRNMGECINE